MIPVMNQIARLACSWRRRLVSPGVSATSSAAAENGLTIGKMAKKQASPN